MKFYKCKDCGSIVILDQEACCGSNREELVPNTTDAAGEKHVPVVQIEGDKVRVCVGSVEHPMLPAHFIQWVVLETSTGYQKKTLTPEQKPCADFVLAEGEKVLAAYEYCNLHGLWKAEV